MTRDDILGQLGQLMPELRRRHSVRTLSLFGSVARGEDTEGSDIDLLVEFNRTPGLMAFAGLKEELALRLGRPVDLVLRSALKPTVAPGALRDEIRL